MTYRILVVMGLALSTSFVHGDIIDNGDFEAYENAMLSTDIAVKEALPVSWIETGIGGHTFIGDTFGSFVALHDPDGIDDVDPQVPYAAWLTAYNEGIYQSFATVPGVLYGVDIIFGQFAPEIIPRLNYAAHDGAGIAGATLLEGFLDADADLYGDGNVTGAYVLAFQATSEVSTILFTLGENSTSKSEGVGIDNVLFSAHPPAVPEPASPMLLLQAMVLAVLATAWRKQRAHRS